MVNTAKVMTCAKAVVVLEKMKNMTVMEFASTLTCYRANNFRMVIHVPMIMSAKVASASAGIAVKRSMIKL